jgi:osmoprotectant transport system permease protein
VVEGEGDVTPLLASLLSDFGDAIEFVFVSREGRGGADIGGSQVLELTWTHLRLTFTAIAIATAIALPLGVWLGHTGRAAFLAISVSNIGRAVPSIGIVFLFFAILGAGFWNITLALVLLAIPPILTNAYVGVREVDPEAVDAARGMGMSGAQIARLVELPLALPLIFGGIRISVVNIIATATLGPEGGVVTLGDPIINPSTYGDAGRLGAAIVVAVLAVIAEVSLSAVQRAITPQGLKLTQQGPSWRLRLPIPRRRVAPAP